MIRSMTGFGRGESNTEIGHLTAEAKSVNSRTCNVLIKLPETLLSLEGQITTYIRGKISRGQINVSVDLNKNGVSAGKKVFVDQHLAKEYCRQLTNMKESFSLTGSLSLSTLAALPGVINVEEAKESPDEVWPVVRDVLEKAVDQLIEMREVEGATILEDLSRRSETMSQLTSQIATRAPEVVEQYRQRLRKRINELLKDQVMIDESRIAMEAAIMAERSDITEEVVRLRSHIGQMRNNLESWEGPVGRHLDFILQEINREVNTIASKASDAQISAHCIQFKDEIEKMREQVQNVE